MTPSPAPWPARLLPSLTDAAFLMPVVFLFTRESGFRGLLGDADTGWHIRNGEWMLANGRVPDKDIFSYTKPGQPWFAWEWLWDLIFGWVHTHAGMAAVVIASMLLLCFTFALVFRLALRRSGNCLLAIGVTFLAAAGSSIHWHARPHLVTLLFVAIYLSLLERAREGRTQLLWWLPALMILWTNLHGGFFVGIILISTYAAGELASAVTDANADARRAALGRCWRYLLTVVGCFTVTFLNPYGYHLHQHMFTYLTGTDMLDVISEFQSLSFHHPAAVYFEPMLVLGYAGALWCLFRRRFTDCFLLLGWAHLALFAARNIPIYLIVAAPIIAVITREMLSTVASANIAGWVRGLVTRFEGLAQEFGEIDRIPRVYAASAVVLALITAIAYAPHPPESFVAQFSEKDFPVKALSALPESQYTRGIFTSDRWGDYLLYRLYPQMRVYFDGRSDFYGPKFTERYGQIVSANHGWEKDFRKYGVDTILLPPDTPLAGALKQSSRWRVVYDDGMAIVFRLRAAPLGPAKQLAGGQQTVFDPAKRESKTGSWPTGLRAVKVAMERSPITR